MKSEVQNAHLILV